MKGITTISQEKIENSTIIQISSTVLPVWKVAITWLAMLGLFLFYTQVIKSNFGYLVFTCGTLLILGFQYGFSSLQQFFSPMKKGTKKWIPIYFLLGFIVSIIIILLFDPSSTGHPYALESKQLPIQLFLLDMISMTFSLLGEEVFVAIIAFPIFGWLNQLSKVKKYAFLISGVISSLIFGLAHLEVYNWDWFQCLIVIGLTRIFYNYAWRKSDSIWAGFWVHTLNNWFALGIGYFL